MKYLKHAIQLYYIAELCCGGGQHNYSWHTMHHLIDYSDQPVTVSVFVISIY